MKKDLPNVFIGVLLGLLIAWLAGLFSPTPTPTALVAKSADAPTAAQPAAPTTAAPLVTVKASPNATVTAPAVAPAKVAQGTPAQPMTLTPAEAAQLTQVRQQSRVKAITNNLRQLSSAAQQYMLDHGVTAASYFDLVGTGTDNYIRNVSPVLGEDYSGVYITQHDTQVMVVAPDGTTVTYNM